MVDSITVRDAEIADLPAILAIHNDAIRHTTAIWDDDEVDLADRLAWFDERRGDAFPILVVETPTGVSGYASYGRWRSRSGYRNTVENSVYVDADHRGKGFARLLMTELMIRAEAGGVHAMVAGIESGNTVSIALHEQFGFTVVARMPEVGYKFGRWLDLTYMQRIFRRDEKSE
ncbi:GNAT family N-acetyltransferase [Jongsikchunia kroppenstedtii]|uniref:GNAT family N-acetyltransferase n=1 Tax=Jongsikchunia kroppenstedtii TaxID=1121721 RepID=UPI0003771040|nr:GNAT family N-acetyltransferase [Jongsikchunia kroppenstedtii]